MSEAHRQPGSSESRLDRGQILLICLVVLAVIASVIMLLTQSDIALKLALIAALWAALIGFFLVVRYRNRAERAEELYEAEARSAERVTAVAAAQRPVPVPAPAPQPEPAQLREEDMAVLSEIRDSLEEVRERLSEMSGQVVEYEPAALHLDAWRIPEIEPLEENSSGAPSAAAVGNFEHTEISPELASLLAEADEPEPVPDPEPAPEPVVHHRHEEDTSHTGRRRADEGGLSVADLMARMREKK